MCSNPVSKLHAVDTIFDKHWSAVCLTTVLFGDCNKTYRMYTSVLLGHGLYFLTAFVASSTRNFPERSHYIYITKKHMTDWNIISGDTGYVMLTEQRPTKALIIKLTHMKLKSFFSFNHVKRNTDETEQQLSCIIRQFSDLHQFSKVMKNYTKFLRHSVQFFPGMQHLMIGNEWLFSDISFISSVSKGCRITPNRQYVPDNVDQPTTWYKLGELCDAEKWFNTKSILLTHYIFTIDKRS